MAGCVAALEASSRGQSTLLIRKGHAATAMSSGTIDVVGPAEFLPFDSWDSLPTIDESLRHILRTRPLHPYSIIAAGRGNTGQLHSSISEACEFLAEKIPSIGLKGSTERNMALPTALGTLKFCAYAPASMAGGDVVEMRGASLLLVGFKGYAHYRPGICRRALMGTIPARFSDSAPRIEFVEIEPARMKGAHGMDAHEVAAIFDDPEACIELAGLLKKAASKGVTHIGLPPVLGLTRHAQAFETVTQGLDQIVFELISPNQSIPGHRLQAALDKALHDGGVRVVNAEVTGAEVEGRTIKNLILGDSESGRRAEAASYITAPGKFSSGGIRSDDYPKEPIFGLPLFVDGKRAEDRFLTYMLDRDVLARQAFLSCGVHVDVSLRPLDESAEPVYDNLFAAGSIIGEYDYVADKCGLGVAALTGRIAGESASA